MRAWRIQWDCMSDLHSWSWGESQKEQRPKQPLLHCRENQICLVFSSLLNILPMFVPDSTLLLPTSPHTLLRAGSLLFYRRMKIAHNLIHSKLLTGEIITSLYSFGGVCILKEDLWRQCPTQIGHSVGEEFQPVWQATGTVLSGKIQKWPFANGYTQIIWSSTSIIQKDLKPSFPLSAHFGPVLDCKILRESKCISIY